MKISVMYTWFLVSLLVTNKEPFASTENNENNRDLVVSAMELALVKLGGTTIDQVSDRLSQKHNCIMTDCYERPECLMDVLRELFGDSYKVIIESMKQDLNKISSDNGIDQFLKTIST